MVEIKSFIKNINNAVIESVVGKDGITRLLLDRDQGYRDCVEVYKGSDRISIVFEPDMVQFETAGDE